MDFLHSVAQIYRGRPAWIVDRRDLIFSSNERRLSEFCELNDCAEYDDGGQVRFKHVRSAPDSHSFGSFKPSLRPTKPHSAFRSDRGKAAVHSPIRFEED